ncbi:MAG: nitrate ABC transporter ATP-binding protein, partial [Chloroflexi bacterium]|nr:nitrate ABC transporter ATP-binding protein [Chloroflexota bacterium]
VKWLMAMLRAADGQHLEREVVETALGLEFPPEEAKRQLETIINWARYAELMAYDDSSEIIYLEPNEA